LSFQSKCIVEELERSRLPSIEIAKLRCGSDVTIKMDIHRDVLTFNKGDTVDVIISKSEPNYTKGKDFLARGFVVTFKERENGRLATIISLWGFIVVVESAAPGLRGLFNYMDEIYFLIRK